MTNKPCTCSLYGPDSCMNRYCREEQRQRDNDTARNEGRVLPSILSNY